MPLVSVIVPVYKSEHYLPRCVESVLAQTYNDFELLLIDDGDPGEAAHLCREFEARDARVKVLRKENGGVSSARNMGLDHAVGDWIVFLDSDDWLDSNMLSSCVEKCTGSDLVRCSQMFVYEDGTNAPMLMADYKSKDDYLRDIVDRRTSLGVWAGMYKRSLFEQHNIRFDTGLVNGEDWLALTSLVYYCENISFVSEPLYCYNQGNPQSCTKRLSMEKILSCHYACRKISDLLQDREDFQSLLRNVDAKILLDAKLACCGMSSFALVKKAYKTVCVEFSQTRARVFRNDHLTVKDKVKFILLNLSVFRWLYWLKWGNKTTC